MERMSETTARTLAVTLVRPKVVEFKRRGSGITEPQRRRIIASLRAGYGERNIAESEGIPERVVRMIRRREYERLDSRDAAAKLAFRDTLEFFTRRIDSMRAEIDRDAFEDLGDVA